MKSLIGVHAWIVQLKHFILPVQPNAFDLQFVQGSIATDCLNLIRGHIHLFSPKQQKQFLGLEDIPRCHASSSMFYDLCLSWPTFLACWVQMRVFSLWSPPRPEKQTWIWTFPHACNVWMQRLQSDNFELFRKYAPISVVSSDETQSSVSSLGAWQRVRLQSNAASLKYICIIWIWCFLNLFKPGQDRMLCRGMI